MPFGKFEYESKITIIRSVVMFLAGRQGLEPRTAGFGDRNSAN